MIVSNSTSNIFWIVNLTHSIFLNPGELDISSWTIFLWILHIFMGRAYIATFHDSTFKGKPETLIVGALTPIMLGLIFILCTTIKFQLPPPIKRQVFFFYFFIALKKSNRKPTNKNFGAKTFLNNNKTSSIHKLSNIKTNKVYMFSWSSFKNPNSIPNPWYSFLRFS